MLQPGERGRSVGIKEAAQRFERACRELGLGAGDYREGERANVGEAPKRGPLGMPVARSLVSQGWEQIMRIIIGARLADEGSDTGQDVDGVLAVIELPDCSLADIGLTLAEGRSLLVKAQAELDSMQVEGWLSGQTHCQRCGDSLSHKDHRSTIVRTVYGKVAAQALGLKTWKYVRL